MADEPPTEPLASALPSAGVVNPFAPAASPLPPPPPRVKTPQPVQPQPVRVGPFSETRYRFTTGLRAGRIAPIRNEEGDILLSYRSFATVAGVVSTLVSAIVFAAGVAAVLFLVAEGAPFRAAIALLLTLVFAFVIRMLVPRVDVTLYDEHHPALTLSQRSVFPAARYVVATPNGATLAELSRSPFSRLGRNRWTILQNGRPVGQAVEESFRRAVVRKFLGKFSRRFETNVIVEHGGLPAARIIRRASPAAADVLELMNDALDRRVVVAVATLILGREP